MSRTEPAPPRNLHARHAASDYDERTRRAIVILRKVDECLLTEGAPRFTRPEVFIGTPFCRA
jgi:hypothetical protein